jgi:putative transposase
MVEDAEVKASMDGKRQCLDNARTGRFFRTLKYYRIYINENEIPRKFRAMLKEYIHTDNTYRSHSSKNSESPVNLYSGVKEQVIAS